MVHTHDNQCHFEFTWLSEITAVSRHRVWLQTSFSANKQTGGREDNMLLSAADVTILLTSHPQKYQPKIGYLRVPFSFSLWNSWSNHDMWEAMKLRNMFEMICANTSQLEAHHLNTRFPTSGAPNALCGEHSWDVPELWLNQSTKATSGCWLVQVEPVMPKTPKRLPKLRGSSSSFLREMFDVILWPWAIVVLRFCESRIFFPLWVSYDPGWLKCSVFCWPPNSIQNRTSDSPSVWNFPVTLKART